MSETGFASFETPLGRCAIAWGPGGLHGLHLAADAARDRAERCWPDRAEALPPAAVRAAIEEVSTHLSGGRPDYARVELDFSLVTAWEESVLRAACGIPFGQTRTYGALAEALGDMGAAQAVGQALGRNPWPIIVPCHRITASRGRMGGFSAPGGTTTKRRLLEIEGALAADTLPLFAAGRD